MDNHPASAKALRQQVQGTQAEQAKLKLFHQFGISLFTEGWQPATLQTVLANLCINMGAPHGLLAIQEGPTLKVLASLGQTYPIGARVPVVSNIANVLKSPAVFNTKQVTSNLWTLTSPHAPTNECNSYVLPITLNTKAIGILAFASIKTELNAEEANTCQSLCGLLGLGLLQMEAKSTVQIDQSILNVLTPREREVFALLPSGHSNTELAEKLAIAPGTVKIHVERILNKLGMRDRTQAAVKAVQMGY